MICIDIDDTITYAPNLFALITHSLTEATIIIVSFRTDHEAAVATLVEHEIRYNKLILSNDPEWGKRSEQSLDDWKSETVNRIAPDWFFEDMPEVVSKIDSDIKVFMPCDQLIRDWLREATN